MSTIAFISIPSRAQDYDDDESRTSEYELEFFAAVRSGNVPQALRLLNLISDINIRSASYVHN